VVAIPATLLSQMAGFDLRWIWYLTVVATYLQVALNLTLLRREFRVRLHEAPAATAAPVQVAAVDI